MADPVQAKPTAGASLAQANVQSSLAQKNLAEVQTAKACIETAVLADKNGFKQNLPKVCDKYLQPKVESTITFPVPGSSTDKDGSGPKK